MKERDLQQVVMDLAKLLGWRRAHFRPAQARSGNWITAMQGEVGFPDIVLVKGERLLFVELKSEKGRLRPEQKEWLHDLERIAKLTPHIEVYVWRPKDWHSRHIERLLKGAQ